MLIIPNLFWTRNQTKDYEKYVGKENKFLLIFERIGEVLVSVLCLIFSDLNIRMIALWSILLFMAALAMILYEIYWIRYFRSNKTMSDFYSSLLGVPVAGAILPVVAFI